MFVGTPRKGLLCRMCNAVFTDPIIVGCGHTFCKRCVVTSPLGALCPSTSHDRPTQLSYHNAIPNLEALEEMGDLMIRCQFGCMAVEAAAGAPHGAGPHVADPDGCPEVVQLSQRQQHEAICPHRTVRCPYNAAVCPKMLACNLEAHLKGCTNVPCRHRADGCKFLGSQDQLSAHLESDCR